MTRAEILEDLKKKFKGEIIDIIDKSEKRVYIEIHPRAIRAVAGYVFKDLGARFNIASGVDLRDRMEILYHFTLEEINFLVSLRVNLPKDRLVIDSIAPLLEGANWIEREIHEMLGITFTGHPDMRRLLLPDEWPQDVYPLRNDYKEWDKKAVRDRGV